MRRVYHTVCAWICRRLEDWIARMDAKSRRPSSVVHEDVDPQTDSKTIHVTIRDSIQTSDSQTGRHQRG